MSEAPLPRIADWAGGSYDTSIPWPTSSDVRIFDLSVELRTGMPRHPYHPPFGLAMAKVHGQGSYPDGITSAMAQFVTGDNVGSHVDALGHIAVDGHVHGGRPVGEQSATDGISVGAVTELPPLIGRGHLLDAEVLFGRELTPADGIGPEQLEQWFADRAQPGRGDVVLVRTGWMKKWPDYDEYLGLTTGLPGVTVEGARWLSSRGILATGSDTMNYEHKPDVKVVALRVHVHNLVESGIPIMESLDLEALAAARAYDFLFVALPLRLRGGTGSPLRPVAVVTR